MVININKFIKNSVYFVCIYLMVINVCCDFFKLPTIIRYIPDVLLPIFVLYVLYKINEIKNNKYSKVFFNISLLFLLHTIIGSIININSKTLPHFIWGFRNIFRFLVISLCAINTFEKDDKEKFIKIIHRLFWINAIVCFFQYFILNYWGDAIGGIFRLGKTGGNAGVIYLLVIENTVNINSFLNKKCSFAKMFMSLVCSIFITVIAELKVMYLFIIAIVLIALLLNKFSLKTVSIVIGTILIMILGYNVLERLDPFTANMLNIKYLMEYASGEEYGYSSKDDISRFRAFKQIDKYFFKENLKYKIWGYGLGNCDESSSFDIFNSNFSRMYNEKFHYTWFVHSMLYLETGIVGYILYISIFIYIIIFCFKNKHKKENFDFYNTVVIVGVLSIIMTFYNSMLRNDISYFVYVFMILPFVLSKNEKGSEEKNENISNVKKNNI